MCWFSQQERIITRRAVEGEDLVVHDYPGQGRWLASQNDLETPVCIPDGCKLRLTNIPQNLQKELKIEAEVIAEFREIHQQVPYSLLGKIFLPPRLKFDVLIFSNGRSLEITMLAPEIRVDVLSYAVLAPVPQSDEPEVERMYVK